MFKDICRKPISQHPDQDPSLYVIKVRVDVPGSFDSFCLGRVVMLLLLVLLLLLFILELQMRR